jgi:hypothetical protein
MKQVYNLLSQYASWDVCILLKFSCHGFKIKICSLSHLGIKISSVLKITILCQEWAYSNPGAVPSQLVFLWPRLRLGKRDRGLDGAIKQTGGESMHQVLNIRGYLPIHIMIRCKAHRAQVISSRKGKLAILSYPGICNQVSHAGCQLTADGLSASNTQH